VSRGLYGHGSPAAQYNMFECKTGHHVVTTNLCSAPFPAHKELQAADASRRLPCPWTTRLILPVPTREGVSQLNRAYENWLLSASSSLHVTTNGHRCQCEEMSAVHAYRTLLRTVRTHIDDSNRRYFESFVKRQFRLHPSDLSDSRRLELLRIANEYAQHLAKTREHTAILKRYNIAVSRDGSQKENVAAIAGKVGLRVPAPPA
jgi:Complex1_LYR-like